MNPAKLFEAQRVLDERIIREKGLEDMDRLPYLIQALWTELGELSNEWRGFKFWSNDRKPRKEKMLVEYVDSLHFILSIGLERGFEKEELGLSAVEGLKRSNLIDHFNYLIDKVGDFSGIRNKNNYMYIINLFIGLGEMLGFTWEEIEGAYFEKNQVNHQRQQEGY